MAPSRDPRTPRLALVPLLLTLVGSLIAPAAVAANSPPDPPVITSPLEREVGADDVHMELGAPYHDPDGDPHRSTDWEISTPNDATVVWAAYQSAELVHAHFSDGVFQGPLAGKRALQHAKTYLFRVRFEDSQGAWSAWSERRFVTATNVVTPMRHTRGLLTQPTPRWLSDGETSIALPVGARLTLEAGDAPLLTLAGDGAGLLTTPHPSLAEPAALRLRLTAADAPVRLPSSRLSVFTDAAERLTVYLPALALEAGDAAVLWVTETGATFYGQPEQTHPDRAHLARDTPLPWSLPPGYRLEAVTSALQMPVSLAFVENPGADPAAPRFYVTELYGRIKVVANDGRIATFAQGLLNVNPTGYFPGSGELGVIGVCLPPTGSDVYATMVFRDPQGSLRNKVARIASTDGLASQAVSDILVAKPGEGVARSSHQIQQCSFGPDGKLYVYMADGPVPAVAQDDATLNGKVLRLNPDGSAPTDNPFYDPANPTAPISYQWTKGQRNAFGMAWRPADGRLYMTENGPDVDRLVLIERGRNYGWDGTNESMTTNALYVWREPHWAPVGLTFVEGPGADAFPADVQGRLLVASAGQAYGPGPQPTGKAIQSFTLGPDGSVVGPPTLFARYVGEGRGSIADLKLRTDGLYFTNLYLDDGDGGPTAPGGKVWRIRYGGRADFTASAVSGPAPLTVRFADVSDVPVASASAWDFGDGAASTEANPTYTFARPGRYAVTLRRADRDGQPTERHLLITVADGAGQTPAPDPAPLPVPTSPAPATIVFPETGVALGGGFKAFWEANGGLTTFGYPITPELSERNPDDGQTYTVQYFERARFEYHPEHQGTPYEIQLGQLGRQAALRYSDRPAFAPLPDEALTPTADRLVFPETRHSLSGAFRRHWEATGGAAIHGLPISEPTTEGEGDEAVLVQYFERTRMEHHPEWAGTADEVRLARLGTAQVVRRPPPRLP